MSSEAEATITERVKIAAELGDAIAEQIIEMDRHVDCTAADFAAWTSDS